MKGIIISSIVLFTLMTTAASTNAQVSVSVNIGIQPDWGPVGYDYVEYYYLPAYEIYYYVPGRQYVYWNGTQWIFVSTLPARFKTVNLYSTYKVVINEPKPYLHHDQVKVKYVNYKSEVNKQVVIRDSNDPKYVEARKHDAQPEKKSPQEKAAPQKNNNNNNDKDKDVKKDKKPDDKHPKQDEPKY